MKVFPYIIILYALLLLAGCSETSALLDDQQLYTGMKATDYTDDPAHRSAKRDTAGVITAVSEAIDSLGNLFSSTQQRPQRPRLEDLTEEQRAEIKAEIKAGKAVFETAKEEVEAVLAYPPNGAILGSSSMRSPIQIGLWTYNKYSASTSRFGKWMLRRFGKDPVLISSVSPDVRAKVATSTLNNYGFFRAAVRYDLITQGNPKKAKVQYHVSAGPLFRLDSIAYVGFPGATDSLIQSSRHRRLLRRGDAFNVLNLTGEQTRIETLLRNQGYYYFAANYVIFRADTIMRPFRVQLLVAPRQSVSPIVYRPWAIGDIYIKVRKSTRDTLTGSIDFPNHHFSYPGEKIPVKPITWLHAIFHRKGDPYRAFLENLTAQKLNDIGAFSQVELNYVPRDTLGNDTLDLYITAIMDKRYTGSFEMLATMKSNSQIGPGLSFGLAKNNAFRGGERVSFKIYGSYEWQTGTSSNDDGLINSYELGSVLSLEYPRIIFPTFSKRFLRFPTSTLFSLDVDWRNRAGFYNMISFEGSATYSWQKKARYNHQLTLISLEFDKMLHTSAAFDSIMDANPALSVSMRDQLIPSMSYSFTYSSSARKRHPFYLQLTVKEAGNIVSSIHAITGKSYSERDKQLLGNPYAQFLKVTAEVHKTWMLSPELSVASRAFGGIVYSYGNSTSAPYADLFYIGGANSVRGFSARSAGPGSYRSNDSKYSYIDQTGDFKLEANVELRARLMGDLYGALFLDAGNVWLIREDEARPGGKFRLKDLKDVAVGTGFGFRYDLEFLVVRFDIGIPLHAPYDTGKSGWYNTAKFWSDLSYHLAIGYPF